jgi:hypothetical protein
LFEPDWDKNIRYCFSELNLDYIVGISNLTHKQNKPISDPKVTPSGKGHYVFTLNVGGAYFLLTKHFNNGIAPGTIGWYEGYTGPGPTFHYTLLKRGFKGVRLLPPGLLMMNPEYKSDKYFKYYDETFSIRGLSELLGKFRNHETIKGITQGICWNDFLNKYYPGEINNECNILI